MTEPPKGRKPKKKGPEPGMQGTGGTNSGKTLPPHNQHHHHHHQGASQPVCGHAGLFLATFISH